MTGTRERIPPHLRRFVVEQDYAAYDEIDQAVWRFILLQTHARLTQTAHPAYVDGLRQTGISVERIPRIEEMDACLADYGWGAVAVDGFIPPRAFQEFQALGIMTIAADIRSSNHLTYTPAPDIVHESAGHAPIVPDPQYRAYLQRFGEIGAKAFGSRDDRLVYEAVYRLSAVKEDPQSTSDQIARAERAVEESGDAVSFLSEAALLSRLHWWTVEYGLVGTPSRYQLYGAGLLSSLHESHFCHAPEVAKLPLTAACTRQPYDISKPQPQLYVAESFAHLGTVLEEVAAGFAARVGGSVGLERAHASGEVATVELPTGLQLIGRVAEVRGSQFESEFSESPTYLQLVGACALAYRDKVVEGYGRDAHPEGYGTPLGRLEDGSALSELCEPDLVRFASKTAPRALRLRYRSGVEVTGHLARAVVGDDGRLLILSLLDCRVMQGSELLFDLARGVYNLAAAEAVGPVYAGAADPDYWPAAESPGQPAPRRSARQGDDARMRGLYQQALRLWENPEAEDLVDRFEQLGDALTRDFPDKWLLRWNLLECLCKARRGPELARRLRQELLAIEARRPRDLPITMGLRYLDEQYSLATR